MSDNNTTADNASTLSGATAYSSQAAPSYTQGGGATAGTTGTESQGHSSGCWDNCSWEDKCKVATCVVITGAAAGVSGCVFGGVCD
ncbi:hypothetical protein V865_001726 [Kwoniella europaea PYCC6329]|uniref:Uncharacterized protein n=1 Tax=Kwoniella europaea PYCC6329 TaxID=1423913 RepID=A0AAX4KDT8_9TREE